MNIRTILTGLCLFLIVSGLHAQREFLKATVIEADGDSITAYISATNWVSTPSQVRYKTSEEGQSRLISANDIRGFIIDSKGIFVSAQLPIDQSSDKAERLGGSAEPIWETQTVFLRQMIKGEVSLFSYKTTNFERFVVYSQDRGYEQLVYKRYLNQSRKLLYNRSFRNQLWQSYNCGITKESLKKVQYTAKSLSRFITQYANCKSFTVQELKATKEKGKLNFYVSAGVGSINGSFGEINTSTIGSDAGQSSFEPAISFRIDAGLEYKFPTENSFSLFFNIASESFTTNGVWADRNYLNLSGTASIPAAQPWNVTTSYGTIGLGVRKYHYFSKTSALRFSAMLIPKISLWSKSSVEILDLPDLRNSPQTLELKEDSHLALGAAYVYKRFSAELRYFFGRDQLEEVPEFRAKYSSYNLSLGVNLN